MLKIDQNTPFVAQWNAQLAPDRGGRLEKTIRKVKEIIFYPLHCLAAACINPRRESQFYLSHPLTNGYGNFNKEIITPDQVHLTAHVYVAEGATQNTPTVILFNPLGTNDGVHDGLKTRLITRKCNVITFNYRGLGSTRKPEDLVIDGDSIYQYAIRELGTDKNKVHFYGFSIGGAFAAQVKALHPESEGKYVSDRTFKSVFSLITENCCIERFGQSIKKITSFISALLIAFPIYLLGWEWDGSKALTQLRGDKRAIYHPNDYLVPFEASLASEHSESQLIFLDPSETGPSTHFSSLAYQRTDDGRQATVVIADFLSK